MTSQYEIDELVQRTYARWLDWGTKLGFALLVCSFLWYAFGLTEPFVAFEKLPDLWGLPVERFNSAVHAPTGWHWLHHWWRSDYLTYFGVVALLMTTIASMVRAASVLVSLGDRLQAGIALAQMLVLVLAATGVI